MVTDCYIFNQIVLFKPECTKLCHLEFYYGCRYIVLLDNTHNPSLMAYVYFLSHHFLIEYFLEKYQFILFSFKLSQCFHAVRIIPMYVLSEPVSEHRSAVELHPLLHLFHHLHLWTFGQKQIKVM